MRGNYKCLIPLLGTAVIAAIFAFVLFIYLVASSSASFSDVFRKKTSLPGKVVLVDASYLVIDGGITTLTSAVLRGMAKKRTDWTFIIFASDVSNSEFKKLSKFKNIKLITSYFNKNGFKIVAATILDFLTIHLFSDVISQLAFYNDIILQQNYDLCWIPDCSATFINLPGPKISTIHDCAHIDVADSLPKNNTEWAHEHVLKASVDADKIITVSNFSKKRIMEEYGVSDDRCKVIYVRLAKRVDRKFSNDQTLSVMGKYGLQKGEYFVFVSSFWKHKNHDNLLRAFAKFIQNTGRKIKLVVVGRHRSIEHLKKIIADNDLDGLVIFTSFIPEGDLNILQSNALAFVHPSLYEGFGMPIIEAMNSGTAVICSNAGSLPEIAGDAALFFDPRNIDDMANAMGTIAADRELRSRLIRLGHLRAANFADTDRMMDEYIKTFEEVMETAMETAAAGGRGTR
ncbi:MAG: glycosyltransferase family 4 protein [Holosporaceae bacterium]|jgi:glycosyltransferase involved in cell wall biosynthesis|nr:glycosyltransferase family 4 protein [Holosporaceae bacterium]